MDKLTETEVRGTINPSSRGDFHGLVLLRRRAPEHRTACAGDNGRGMFYDLINSLS
jgi:hypothetical protein